MQEAERTFLEQTRAAYLPRSEEENKLEQLKRLDRAARRPANIFAYIFGAVAALVLGVGMCICMGTLSAPLAVGVVVGVVGLAMAGANYPIYRAILRAGKKKYAEKICALSDELLAE